MHFIQTIIQTAVDTNFYLTNKWFFIYSKLYPSYNNEIGASCMANEYYYRKSCSAKVSANSTQISIPIIITSFYNAVSFLYS